MSAGRRPPAEIATEELSVLIKTLRETNQRLEELTHGEIDTVADREGRSFLLHRAQGQLRYTEAAKQAAILNALPAHIALLDTRGIIVSVNEAWGRFAGASVLLAPKYGIGLNYLEKCESARGTCRTRCSQGGGRHPFGATRRANALFHRIRMSYGIRTALVPIDSDASD